MGETVVGELLQDLRREGWSKEAVAVEKAMELHAEAWNSQPAPYGSEMPWDSTGQEGVYYWTNYAGKLQCIERMIHHHGSSLNALPVLEQFRQQPKDAYLLRVGYGGIAGPLTNIRQDRSMYNAFHSFPDTLRGDDYAGDYGPNFLGVMLGSATYVVEDLDLGLVAYGGNLVVNREMVTVEPRDAVRQRVYIASMGVYIITSSGWIEQFSLARTNTKQVMVRLVPGPSKATFRQLSGLRVLAQIFQYRVASAGAQLVRRGWQVQLANAGLAVTIARA